MKHVVRMLVALIALGIVATGVSIITPERAAAAAAAAVQVVNTSANPVPVTGNVTASISGPVTATVSGPLTLAAGSTVTVGNSSLNPVPVQDVTAARQPVFGGGGCFFSNGSCAVDLYTVPAGYRLVVEHVSVNVQMSADQYVSNAAIGAGAVAPNTVFLGEPFDYFVLQQLTGTTIYQSNFQTLIFLSANQIFRLQLGKNATGSGGAANARFSGYLIPE